MLIRVSAWYRWKIFFKTSLACKISAVKGTLFSPLGGHIIILSVQKSRVHVLTTLHVMHAECREYEVELDVEAQKLIIWMSLIK